MTATSTSGSSAPAARSGRRAVVTVLALLTVLTGLAPLGTTAASASTSCTAGTGPYQRQLERHLRLTVDGRNSTSDCRAIRRLQHRHGIRPATGYAGPTTHALVKRVRLARDRADRCVTRAKVVCVDLTSQMVWIARDGRRVWGPFPVRSGRDGYETRTGRFSVYRKNIDHVSSIYGSPMPYAMFFSGGMAFHTSDRYLYDPLGSHGCVHVLPRVAPEMWERVKVGTTVHVFGRKPGT